MNKDSEESVSAFTRKQVTLYELSVLTQQARVWKQRASFTDKDDHKLAVLFRLSADTIDALVNAMRIQLGDYERPSND